MDPGGRFYGLTDLLFIQVNWAFFTPSVIALIQPSEVPTLKTIAVGGEAVTQDCVDIWASRVQLFNAYGPTECCVFCLVSRIYPGSNPANIGYGVGSRAWIVSQNDHYKISPIGSVGELLIQGKILSRGYLNDPEKTRSVFTEEPNWARDRDGLGCPRRLYKTGDLARYNADGTVTCLGRKDRQVKIRGQRIEPGEIESRIKQHTGDIITQAVVDISLRGLQKGSQVLTAFLAFNQTHMQMHGVLEPLGGLIPTVTGTYQKLIDRLEVFLSNSLPAHMVPAIFVPLIAIPKTISGKIDRVQLQAISECYSAKQRSALPDATLDKQVAVRTKPQVILRREWSILLGLPESSIGLNDRFFALGGNSIMAIKLVSAVRRQGLFMTVADIFHNSALSDMAATVGEPEDRDICVYQPFSMLGYGARESPNKIIDTVAEQCMLNFDSVLDIYPCTPFQEGLMAVSVEQTGLYTGQYTFELPNGIDLERFRVAWSAAVRQIDTLRTRIVDIPSVGCLQVVIDDDIHWLYPKDLETYCLVDTREIMAYGGQLTRYALVEERGRAWFVWTIHHALYDGWCLPKYLEVVSGFYHRDRQSMHDITPFRNFIRYSQSSFNKDTSSAFWRSALDGASSPQFPRLPSTTYEPRINGSVTVRAVVLDRTMPHITIAMLVQAAWALVVAQHTASTDVIFGTVVTGRNVPLAGIDSIAGPTLATTPARIHVDYETSIGSFLDMLRERATAMMPHEQDGLQRIKQSSEDARNACDFQTILVIQPDQGDEAIHDELLLQIPKHQAENVGMYGLALECIIKKNALTMEARFDSEIISYILMERILQQWRHVVQQLAAANTDQPVHSLSFISPEDMDKLHLWNSVEPPPTPGYVHEKISKWAKLQPHAIAICSWEGVLSYQELEDYSSRLAGLLIALGVGPETIVPLHFDKSIPVVVAMMGVLKAGGAFVPLDCSAPNDRIKEILTQVDATFVLISERESRAWPSNIRPIPVGMDLLSSLPEMKGPAAVGLRPNHLAYLIMTSGSTGRPKAVMIEHSSLSTSVEYHGRYYGLNRQSRVLQFASLAFDAAVGDVMATTVHGGCLVMPHKDTRMDNLIEFINETRVNWSFFTPSTLKAFRPSDVPTIDTLVVGGEAITDDCIETWAGHVHLINGYGPSETTIACAAASVSPDGSNRSSIGEGLGCLTWVVAPHDHNRLAPFGTVGELLIQGPIVGRGYLNNEEQTLAAFIENPTWLDTGTQQSVRLYKTGDLVHYNDDGTLQYVGRKDSQVKVRGQRVELGEVESHLQSTGLVDQAAVIFPASGASKERLVAFLTLKCEFPISVELSLEHPVQPSKQKDIAQVVDQVRNSILEQLSQYMIPVYWVVLDNMPITTSGKIDRKVLSRWMQGLTHAECEKYQPGKAGTGLESMQPASTPKERLLQDAWADVLNVPPARIGVNLSFQSLGGDSLMAMQVSRRCRTKGFKINVRDVLRGQSIAQLAQHLPPVIELPATLREERTEQLFELSPIQKMYAAIAPLSERHHFNQSQRLRVKRKIDRDELEAALGAVVRHHSMLRAKFLRSADGLLAQQISQNPNSSYRVQSHLTSDSQEMSELMAQSQEAVDITNGPIIVADIINSASSDESTLFLVAHHLVVDYVSWRIIIDDLEAVLREGRITGPVPLPFQTWCSLQTDHVRQNLHPEKALQEAVPRTDLEYWDVSRSQITYGGVARERFVLDEAQSKNVLGNCHQTLKTEPMDLFVAALLESFQQTFTDRGPPAMFTEAHGREPCVQDIDPSNTVGWFTTICPNVVTIDVGMSSIAILKQVKDMRRRIPFNGWEYFSSRFLHPEGSGMFSDSEFPEIVFNNTGMNEPPDRLQSLFASDPNTVGDVGDMSPNMTRFALIDVTASFREGRIEFEWLFSPSMRHAEKIGLWIQNCRHILEQTPLRLNSMRAEFTLSDFPLMSMSYGELGRMLEQTIPRFGVRVPEEIEDIYPASPTQQAMLAAQASSPRYYRARMAFEVNSNCAFPIDAEKLCKAWHLVVDQYQILRTVLLPGPKDDGAFVQIVLKSYNNASKLIERSAQWAKTPLSLPSSTLKPNEPPHKMTVCKVTNEKTVCCWDISHALIDHASMSMVLESFSQAYAYGRLAAVSTPYVNLISHITATTEDPALDYWNNYLRDSTPCQVAVPAFVHATNTANLSSTTVDLSPVLRHLDSITEETGVTLANIFRLAWALVLGQHLCTNDVVFGYLVSGRDVPIDNVDQIVGPLLNVLACRFHDPLRSVPDMLGALQKDFLESLPHQHHLLTFLQSSKSYNAPGLNGHFDTLVNFRRHANAPISKTGELSFEILEDEDPFNVGQLPLFVS